MSVNKVNPDGSLTRIAGGTLYADMPMGTIVPYGGSTAPSGFLICDGSAVSRTTYAELFKAIGTAFGSGNGSTTFNLPDLRETVPVGAGTRSSGVASHDTYEVGVFKDDQLQNIKTGSDPGLQTAIWTGDSSDKSDNPLYKKTDLGYQLPSNGSYGSFMSLMFDASRVARTGTTTHGKQLGVNYIIKAKQAGVPQDIRSAVYDMLEETNAYINKYAPMTIASGLTLGANTFTLSGIATGVYEIVVTDLARNAEILAVYIAMIYNNQAFGFSEVMHNRGILTLSSDGKTVIYNDSAGLQNTNRGTVKIRRLD